MLKKVIIGFMGILLLFSFPLSAQASELRSESQLQQIIDVKPAWTSIATLGNNLNIYTGGNAVISVTIIINTGTSVKVQAYLQKYDNGNWVTVNNWETTFIGAQGGLGRTCQVNSGTYRNIAIVTTYNNGVQIEQIGDVSAIAYY